MNCLLFPREGQEHRLLWSNWSDCEPRCWIWPRNSVRVQILWMPGLHREPVAVAKNLLSAINSCSLFCLNYRQWSFDVIRGDSYYRLILYYTQMNTNSFGATPIHRPYARRQRNSGDCWHRFHCTMHAIWKLVLLAHDWLQCALLLRTGNWMTNGMVHVPNHQCVYKPKTSTFVSWNLLLVDCLWTACRPLAIQSTKNPTVLQHRLS